MCHLEFDGYLCDFFQGGVELVCPGSLWCCGLMLSRAAAVIVPVALAVVTGGIMMRSLKMVQAGRRYIWPYCFFTGEIGWRGSGFCRQSGSVPSGVHHAEHSQSLLVRVHCLVYCCRGTGSLGFTRGGGDQKRGSQ